MSAEDVWQLKIPIRLTLAQDEISSPGDVKPVYLLAPRFAYLPALAQQCLSFFQHVLLQMPGQDKDKPAPWFEYEGLALSWTQPLGILHDLLTPQPTQWPSQQHQQQYSQYAPVACRTSAIPWCLTVHFRNQPASLANSWQNNGTAQDHYLSSLKEAGYCCRGTDGCNAVMRLTVQDELWAAVNRGDGAVVRQHLTPLRLTPTQRQGSAIPTVPVRLYIRQHKADSAAGLTGVWSDVYSTNRAVEVQQPDGSATLLAHLAHSVMPQRFPALQQQHAAADAASGSIQGGVQKQRQPQAAEQGQSKADEGHQGAAGSGVFSSQQQQEPQKLVPADDPLGVLNSSCSEAVADVGGAGSAADRTASSPESILHQTAGAPPPPPPAAAAAEQGNQAAATAMMPPQWPATCAVCICGIQPDWCTPLGWLHANFKAADGFLYVVMHLTS